MADSHTLTKRQNEIAAKILHFDVSTGLKRVLGRELITTDEVAIFEMVKNSFDAKATEVHLYFSDDQIIVADNGQGMSFEDLRDKWLFVAYSAKREQELGKDFRDVASDRHFAGSKGIGRFSSDRLGEEAVLQTRPTLAGSGPVHRIHVDWAKFDRNAREHFERIGVRLFRNQCFRRSRRAAEVRVIAQARHCNPDWVASSKMGTPIPCLA